MDAETLDEARVVALAVAELNNRFPSIDPSRIEATARRQVMEWFGRARVKTFVGIIAARHARAELQRVSQQESSPNKTGRVAIRGAAAEARR